MHPDMGEPAFARWYTSDPLIGAVKGLLDCDEDELQMGELDPMLLYGYQALLNARTFRAVQHVNQPRIACVCLAMASRRRAREGNGG